jgi:hypothetical protein
MPERPLLVLPRANEIDPPPGSGRGSKIRFPSRDRQTRQFEPIFERLRNAFGQQDRVLHLRDDPSGLAPERVIVFEIAGTVDNFVKAAARVQGLEFMAEFDSEFSADENFAVVDEREGRAGQDRLDKPVSGRFYLAMPDTRALQELLSLWERWRAGQALPRGFAAFRHVFEQLRDLRPWGQQDRIPDETIAYWREEAERNPNQPVRTEVELWFRNNAERRLTTSQTLGRMVTTAGGAVVHEGIIPEIAYHGVLVDIPAAEVHRLIEHEAVSLAIADDVMFLRPQSMLRSPMEIEAEADGANIGARPAEGNRPIAALFDGMPVQAHSLLDGRLILDDPDNLEGRATVNRRIHGTAMASLILHGDRNEGGSPLGRPLYVRPIMLPHQNGFEATDRDRLVIDTVYRAVTRMKGVDGAQGSAPSVFVVNLSLGDTRRPFAGMVSPLARLLDFLSHRYGILFLVSAGNVGADLMVDGYETWNAFEGAAPEARERAVLSAINAAKHDRTILSPAESLNALTVGARHHDSVAPRVGGQNAIDPFQDSYLPNVSSGLGLGHRRMIKPEIFMPGGREYVRMKRTGGGLVVSVGSPQRLYGLKAAAPDPTGRGRLDYAALSDGTSSATALSTRAAHHIFDALMDREGGSMLADMDPGFYAVALKCLLVHGAQWNGNDELLKEIFGPADRRQHVERAENASRFIGFGVPQISAVLECASNQATLVGVGELNTDSGHRYRIPLPGCLERVTEPRSLTVSVAWFSPVKPGHQSYRCVRLEAASLNPPMEVLGVERRGSQPADASIKRGSVFHEHFEGDAAVPFLDDGHLSLQVWCKEDAGLAAPQAIQYALAVTLRAQADIPVYDQVQARLRIRPEARA